jgi:hypothetical protein
MFTANDESVQQLSWLRELIFHGCREIHRRSFEEPMRSLRSHIALAPTAARPTWSAARPCAFVCGASSSKPTRPEAGSRQPQ